MIQIPTVPSTLFRTLVEITDGIMRRFQALSGCAFQTISVKRASSAQS